MAKKKKNKEKLDSLEDEFSKIKDEHKVDFEQHLVDPEEDLPGFGEIDVYDYDSDLEEVKNVSKKVIENLADLYLGDAPHVINHPYVQQKMLEDMYDYADTKFLSKMGRKLLLQQLKQIDSGDIGARMYEVSNQTIREIRENIKESRSSRSEIESFYKNIRIDLGLNEINENKEEVDNEDDNIINTKNLNDKIDEFLKNKGKGEK